MSPRAAAKTLAAGDAGRIEARCAVHYADANYVAECNWFVWRVAEDFFPGHSHGLGAAKGAKDADTMIAWMQAGNGWTRVAGANPGAIVDSALDVATQGN